MDMYKNNIILMSLLSLLCDQLKKYLTHTREQCLFTNDAHFVLLSQNSQQDST